MGKVFALRQPICDMLARALQAAGRADEAIAELRKAIALVETAQEQIGADALGLAAFLQEYADLYVRLVELLVARGDADEAFRVAEQMKGRGLREAISSSRIDVSASLSDDERSREKTLEGRVAELNRAILAARQKQQPTEELEQQLAAARRDLDAFRSEMRIKHPAVGRTRFDVAPVFELPAGDESLALIEYVVGDEQVTAFVVRRGSPVRAVRIPIASKDLRRAALELENLLAARSPEYRKIAKRLYATLLTPLEHYLPAQGTLAIIPDAVLWTVPFHALVADDGRYLIDRRPVFYAHSLHLLRQASTMRTSAPSGLFALGNPTISADARSTAQSVFRDTPLDALLDAEVEVRSLSSMYPSERKRVYYRDAATENAFKNEAAGYSVIHIAAHAIVDDRAPLYSAIVLAHGSAKEDGLLEAREIVDLPLNADLAVLSACETARGKVRSGEGVIGLLMGVLCRRLPNHGGQSMARGIGRDGAADDRVSSPAARRRHDRRSAEARANDGSPLDEVPPPVLLGAIHCRLVRRIRRSERSAGHRRVRDLQRAIDDRERLAQLFLGDAQRRVGEEVVPVHEGVHAVLAEERAELLHFGAGAVEGGHRFFRRAVADELEDAEQADRADVADGGVFGFHVGVQVGQDAAHALGVADGVVVHHDLQAGFGGGEAHGVGVVGEAAVEDVAVEVAGDAVAHGHGAEGQVGGRQALGHGDHVGHDVPVIDGEPASRSAEAAHHFVGDEEDAVAVADGAQALQVAVRRNDEAVRAGDGLDEDRGDGVRTFVREDLFDLVEAAAREHLVGVAFAVEVAAVFVGIEEADHAGQAGLVRPAPRIAGE